MKHSRGFTLIELLVVVAIISLLVSILLPSLQRAREMTRTVVCTTNLRGVGLALHLYCEDGDDYLPFGFNPAPGLGSDPRLNNWMPYLHPYLSPGEDFWPDDYRNRLDGALRCTVIDPDRHANPGYPMSYI